MMSYSGKYAAMVERTGRFAAGGKAIRVPQQGEIRVSVACFVPDVLRALGADPNVALREAGLELHQLADPDAIIPYSTLAQLIEICSRLTQCQHFGLLVGASGGLASIGLVGRLIEHAPDVGTALRNLVAYLHFHDRGAAPLLTVTDQTASLSYTIYEPGIPATDHISDGAIAVAFNLMKSLCGSDWAPREVLLPRRKPDNIEFYSRIFEAPVRFNSHRAAVVFPAFWLERKPPLAHAQLHEKIASGLRQTCQSYELPLHEKTKRILVYKNVTAESFADLMGIHRRTLTRRLRAEGYSFDAISNQVRFELSRRLLTDTDMSIIEIANTFKYSEASAFTRAFRRWSGRSPSDWRKWRRAHSRQASALAPSVGDPIAQ
jgi:AraC-like DNA-binding protein